MDRKQLEGKDRDELVAMAEKLGVERPRVLTRDELVDEVLRRSVAPGPERARARGWLGRARDLLASVVEHGLHLPDAARALRTAGTEPPPPPPIATVTLAEIYAAQGHVARAVGILDEVLAREPGHAEAARIREQFLAGPRRGAAEAVEAAPDAPAPPASASEESAPPATIEAAPAAVEAPAPHAAPPAPAASRPSAPEPAVPGIDVDDVVALAVAPGEMYVYWELRAASVDAARAASPEGALVLRVVAVTPSWDGPLTVLRDVPVAAPSGDSVVRDLPPGAVIRVSVGWRAADGDAFEPLAVGAEVSSPRAVPTPGASTAIRRWTGPRRPPADVETPLRPIVAAALARAHGAPPPASTSPWAPVPAASTQPGDREPVLLSEQRLPGAAVGALPDPVIVPRAEGLRLITWERGGASELIRRERLLPAGAAGAPWGGASELGGSS